jgi:hypothetical protein
MTEIQAAAVQMRGIHKRFGAVAANATWAYQCRPAQCTASSAKTVLERAR